MKRKINLGRSSNVIKCQRLLRLSKINNIHDLVEPRRVPWRRREMSAFTYDKLIDYKNDSHVIIGNMNLKCNYCRALKWSKEPAGFC